MITIAIIISIDYEQYYVATHKYMFGDDDDELLNDLEK